MTAIRVIVLAQGQQTRLTDLGFPKQLADLPACKTTIIGRTLRQLAQLIPTLNRPMWPPSEASTVSVICGREITQACFSAIQGVEFVDLADPGNSSLKGLHRYLHHQRRFYPGDVDNHTAVLLGDVVYSWAALEAILSACRPFPDGVTVDLSIGPKFVGSSDLSTNAGELWGIGYPRVHCGTMEAHLERAMDHHPPFHDTYQPGQMRRWLWEIDRYYDIPIRDSASIALTGPTQRPWFSAIDDYTRDVDTWDHVKMLPEISLRAHADDEEHGW